MIATWHEFLQWLDDHNNPSDLFVSEDDFAWVCDRVVSGFRGRDEDGAFCDVDGTKVRCKIVPHLARPKSKLGTPIDVSDEHFFGIDLR